MALANMYVHKSQNLNSRMSDDALSTVWMFDANNNFKMTIGPPMNNGRDYHSCGIYHSGVHSGRPVIVTAGSFDGVGKKKLRNLGFYRSWIPMVI